MVIAYAAFFSLLTVQRHHSQLTTANDMGIFDQILWNVVHGRGMQRSIEINYSHWGVHTQPIIYLIAVSYIVRPGPETLLVAQSVALALSAIPLYLVAQRETQRNGLSLLLVAAYLLSPALEGMNLIDFHPYAFAALFLLWAFYFLETPHVGLFGLSALLAVACKEDVALVVAMMGLYAAVFTRRRALGLLTFGAALGWYALAVLVTQPYFSGGLDKQGWRYEALAWPLPELIQTIFTRPQVWVPYALLPAKRVYLMGLLWPFGFLPLFAPHVTGIALPAVMINLLSSFAAQHEPDLFQYNAAIVPFVALGTVRTVAWLTQWPANPTWQRRLGMLVTALLLIGSLSYHFGYGHTPLAAHFHMPQCGVHCATRSELVARVAPEAPVAAQTTLVPHLSQRQFIIEYPHGLNVANYVLLDVTSAHYSIPLTDDYHASIESLWSSGDFDLVAAKDGFLLFGRRQLAPTFDLSPQFYSYALTADDAPTQALDLDFGPLRLVGADYRLARKGWVETTLHWQAQGDVPPSYRPSIALGYSEGALTAWHRQDLPFRWAQRGWQRDEVVRLTTGVSTGHGFDAGWGTGWTVYAGVVDDATGAWIEPREVNDGPAAVVLRVRLEAQEGRFVPLVWLRNYWGVTVLQGQR
jgi:uncharacterized membrane protein